jgi:redox-sensitive bicupin YhaK (pirin superfamily)
MLEIRRSDQRGRSFHGWLDARHTFAFAGYVDRDWEYSLGFGPLRVLNHDLIMPGRGFPTHGHRDMEIVTYVLRGALEHEDSMGSGSVIRPGDVQLMSAGTGVTHSEYNASQEDVLELFQMWVIPEHEGTEPRYAEHHFPAEERRGRLALLVSPDGAQGSLVIGQDARLHAAFLAPGEGVEHVLGPGRAAWLQLARGRVRVDGQTLVDADGVGVLDQGSVRIESTEEAELVLWDLPASG